MSIISGVRNFFKRKSRSFGAVVMRYLSGNGIRATENYERLVKESYGLNSVVYACVKEIASAASCIEFVLKKRVGDREEVIDNHPILDLLRNPNPLEGGTEFIEKLVSYYQLSGSAFLESAGPLFGRGQTRELYVLRPDRMTITPDRVNLIGGYVYKVGNEKVKYDTDQVRHIKMFNPLDDFKGMSPIQVAALAIDKMNQGDRWNAAMMENMAVPSGAMVAKGILTDEQFKRLKGEIKEEVQGVKNAREPLLLEGGLEWQEMGLNPKDMDWIEGLKMSALQICQVYNMPPELVGLTPATYQNRKEARKALYTEVVLPLMKILCSTFNSWLVPRFGENLFLSIDKDKIEALSEDQEALWKRANESDFLTINQKLRLVGIEDHKHGDVLLVPINKIPIEDAVSGAADLDETNLGGDEEEDEKSCGLHCSEEKELQIENGKAFTKSERSRFRKEFLTIAKLRRQFEKKYQRKTAAFLNMEAGQVANAYKEDPVNGALQVVKENKGFLLKLFESLHRDVLKTFGKETLNGLKATEGIFESKDEEDIALDLFDSLALQLAKKNAAKAVALVSETSKKKIRTIIAAAIEQGQGVGQVTQSLRDGLKNINAARARTIARTEIHDAQNQAQLESVKALGRNDMEKGWMWSGKSRAGHAEIDGTWVGLNETFIVIGKEMDRPGDSKGGPENVINCTCVLVFRRSQNQE